jgi:hypothetical protein
MERWSWRSVNVQVGQVEDVELHQSGQRWKGGRERRLAQPREVFKGKTRRGELMKKRISKASAGGSQADVGTELDNRKQVSWKKRRG